MTQNNHGKISRLNMNIEKDFKTVHHNEKKILHNFNNSDPND